MRNQLLGATLLGAGMVLGSIGTAHASLMITPSTQALPPAPFTPTFKAETGASIPDGTGGFLGGLLTAVDAGTYTFTYGPLGLVPGATGHGDSTNVNEFTVGTNHFCTQALADCGGAATAVGASFTVSLSAGENVPFSFLYDQTGGAHTLTNGQRDDTNGGYLAQIGLDPTGNPGPGPVAYLGLSDNPLNDSDFQDLTVQVTETPEPASMALLGSGLLGLAFAYRRRTRKAAHRS